MRKFRSLLLIITLFISHGVILSSPADTSSIIDYIYNFDFNKAEEKLCELNNSNLLINESLNLEIKWWMAMESDKEEQFSDFLIKLNQFENNRIDNLSKIISLTYRMRYYACINKKYMLPFLFMNIKNHIEKIDISEFDSRYPDDYQLFIIYKSFLNLVQYGFSFERLMNISQNKQVYIRDIEHIINYGTSAHKTIGRYFLMKYYLDIEKDKPKALGYLTVLRKQYPGNKIFTQLLIN
jgi:hypothetical protein